MTNSETANAKKRALEILREQLAQNPDQLSTEDPAGGARQ